MSFQNKTIWITGASSGIGEALSYELDRLGATLILSARREEELSRVKNNCAHAKRHHILCLDLTIIDELPLKVEEALSLTSKIDILINNGGISQRSLIKDTPMDVDFRIMQVDYFGNIALTKALLPHFLENKAGHIVAVSSVAGKIGVKYRSAYCAAKHALIGFMDSLRAEVYEHGVMVTVVTPGFIKTQVSNNALTADGSKKGSMDKNIENGMQAEECARFIARQILAKKDEFYVGNPKEAVGLWLKRFFPTVSNRVMRTLKEP